MHGMRALGVKGRPNALIPLLAIEIFKYSDNLRRVNADTLGISLCKPDEADE